ncbi:phosphatidylserine lipase ABHD16A [Arctopsyche grandis]|uniref:phosphatidylserine lipase ABHD16A n=1 Tax=Arctopsyche grandis TaxID=121162 RepID=UPI00406D8A0B
MITKMKEISLCMFGPRLYKVHLDGPPTSLYLPRYTESWGDRVIYSLNLMWKISIFTCPFVSLYFYKRDYIVISSFVSLFKLMASVGFVMVASLCMRGYGRVTNPQYREFIRALTEPQNKTQLRRFDFDFTAWPVDFDCGKMARSDKPKFIEPNKRQRKRWNDIAMNIIGGVAVRSFGLKLIYPGSTSILYMFVEKVLLEGRIKLVEEYGGKRYKIKTRDNNEIDSMFVDRRGVTQNGKTLVVTSEGNAGFYEIGVMTTPIEAGYSVLGYNHPGFASSTGLPYPLEEQHAIDAIMQFAINELKFVPDNIVLFGWSIGCYSIAWAAVQYPDVKGIILDATFDDLLPLGLSRMPPSWRPMVTEVIRGYVDLNIADLLKDYSGPIKLIRRTMDEIICIDEGRMSTNRGNDLLIKILAHRYRNLFEADQYTLLRQYLSLQGPALSVFVSADHPGDMDKNKKVLFLAGKYLTDYKSTHCTPLPKEYLQIPRDLTLDEDFVFT